LRIGPPGISRLGTTYLFIAALGRQRRRYIARVLHRRHSARPKAVEPKGLSASFLTHRLTESSILKAAIVARENPGRNCQK
jgi:hypothetical protein